MTAAQRDIAFPNPAGRLIVYTSDAVGSEINSGRLQMYDADRSFDAVWLNFLLTSDKRLQFPDVFFNMGENFEDVTISAGGTVTATRTHLRVETNGGAGTDDLDAILGGQPNDLLVIAPKDGAHTVVLKHGIGGSDSIFMEDASDLSLTEATDFVLLMRTGVGWHVMGRGALQARQHDHADVQGGSVLDASVIQLPTIGSPTYSNVEDLNTVYHSAGWINGGVISDAGGATINVAAGAGALRASNSPTAQLRFGDWAASNGLAITADSIRYIGVEDGTPPVVVVRTTNNFNLNTDFPLGTVVNEGGTLHIQNAPWEIGDHANFMIQRVVGTAPIARDKAVGGLIFSETGTRNVVVSTGALWRGLTKFTIGALDTDPGGAADTFDTYSADGQKATGVAAWPNTQYDDGDATLQDMGNNKWANLWWYIELDGELVMVYGTNQYVTQAQAEAEAAPSVLPERLQVHGVLAARFIFQKSAGTAAEILSAFDTQFSVVGVTDHGNLAGLEGSDHDAHFDIDGSKAMTGDIDLDGNNIDNGGVVFLKEQADADADVAGSGQLWVNTATPNELWFTGDDGIDQPLTVPKRSIIIRAGTLVPNTTNPCADAVQAETGTGGKNYITRSFAANEQGSMEMFLPENYDGGTVTWWYAWISPTDSSAGDTVIFGLRGSSTQNGDLIGEAQGAQVTITDTLLTGVGRYHKSDESSALTIAGSPSGGDLVIWEVERTGGDMTEEAPLLMVYIRYGTNNASDE
jgi:hypothetical protein